MEYQFSLISIDSNSVDYDLGDGYARVESTFRAASYPNIPRYGNDIIIIEHDTSTWFGRRDVLVSGITINTQKFTDASAAVAAINALDIRAQKPSGGNLDIPADFFETNGKINPQYLPDKSQDWFDVTHLFDIPTTARVHALMFDSGISAPVIELFGIDESGSDNDLVIVAPYGLGSMLDYPNKDAGRKPLDVLGGEWDENGNWVSGAYSVVITQEVTGISRTSVTIPHQVGYFQVRYPMGAVDPAIRSILDLREGDEVVAQQIDFRGNGLPIIVGDVRAVAGEVIAMDVVDKNTGVVRVQIVFVINSYNTPIRQDLWADIYDENGSPITQKTLYSMGYEEFPDGWQVDTLLDIPENCRIDYIYITPYFREYADDKWNLADIKVK